LAWIAWVKGLTHRCEVLNIARKLGIDPKLAAACCMLVWEWADDETENGDVFVPLSALLLHADSITCVPGFGAALADVGWLIADGDKTRFPNWTRFNGDTTKKRLKETLRKSKWRAERDKCPAIDGTQTSPEKSRVDINITPPTPPKGGNGSKNKKAELPFSKNPEVVRRLGPEKPT